MFSSLWLESKEQPSLMMTSNLDEKVRVAAWSQDLTHHHHCIAIRRYHMVKEIGRGKGSWRTPTLMMTISLDEKVRAAHEARIWPTLNTKKPKLWLCQFKLVTSKVKKRLSRHRYLKLDRWKFLHRSFSGEGVTPAGGTAALGALKAITFPIVNNCTQHLYYSL